MSPTICEGSPLHEKYFRRDDALLEGIAQFYSDRFIDQHRRLTSIVHQHDCKIFLQAALVDSVFPIDGKLYRLPVDQLSNAHVDEVIQLFTESTVRAKAAGYDGVQLHVAHGFFLSQFVEYDRGKILGDILDHIRAELGEDYPVIAKRQRRIL